MSVIATATASLARLIMRHESRLALMMDEILDDSGFLGLVNLHGSSLHARIC